MTTVILLILASLCPSPHADALRELEDAETWQVALFAAEIPTPHAAHDDAANRVDYWQWQAWATCPGIAESERAEWLAWALVARFEKWIR